MSKQNRENVRRHSQLSLDALFELAHMENLTVDEYKEYHNINDALGDVVKRMQDLVSSIEERKEREKPSVPLDPVPFTGPRFSWQSHEERAKLRKQLAKLRAQLDRMGD